MKPIIASHSISSALVEADDRVQHSQPVKNQHNVQRGLQSKVIALLSQSTFVEQAREDRLPPTWKNRYAIKTARSTWSLIITASRPGCARYSDETRNEESCRANRLYQPCSTNVGKVDSPLAAMTATTVEGNTEAWHSLKNK